MHIIYLAFMDNLILVELFSITGVINGLQFCLYCCSRLFIASDGDKLTSHSCSTAIYLDPESVLLLPVDKDDIGVSPLSCGRCDANPCGTQLVSKTSTLKMNAVHYNLNEALMRISNSLGKYDCISKYET